MNYFCTVGFETDKLDKETGLPKTKNSKYLVDGVTLYDALMNILEYLKGDSRGYNIKSITEAKLEDVIKEKAGAVTQLS